MLVERLGAHHQLLRDIVPRDDAEKGGHRVTPGVGPATHEDGLERLLRRLLGGEAGPVVRRPVARVAGKPQIGIGLAEPVEVSRGHRAF